LKKVSIVIPLYKSEKFLTKLLDSIMNQTYKNIEIILVDDGSPDTSGEIADNYAKKDIRFLVIHKENGGCCDARNKGLEKASGEYLMFADGDDWMELDCIEYLVRIAEDNGCEMSTTDAIFTTRNREQNNFDSIRVMNKSDAVASIINTFYIPVGPWNKLYSMKIVKENNLSFSVPWFGEGLYFSAMAAQYSNKMAVGHRKVYNYRLNNPNSGCTLKEVQNGINSMNNILYIKKSLKVNSKSIEDALNWHIWTNYFHLADYIYSASAVKEYKNEYIEAKNEMRVYMPKVMKNSTISVSDKIKILLKTIFPVFFIKYGDYKAKRAFQNDTME
jgi:glycosyltransferase involved in cell wall biosynthesis